MPVKSALSLTKASEPHRAMPHGDGCSSRPKPSHYLMACDLGLVFLHLPSSFPMVVNYPINIIQFYCSTISTSHSPGHQASYVTETDPVCSDNRSYVLSFIHTSLCVCSFYKVLININTVSVWTFFPSFKKMQNHSASSNLGLENCWAFEFFYCLRLPLEDKTQTEITLN